MTHRKTEQAHANTNRHNTQTCNTCKFWKYWIPPLPMPFFPLPKASPRFPMPFCGVSPLPKGGPPLPTGGPPASHPLPRHDFHVFFVFFEHHGTHLFCGCCCLCLCVFLSLLHEMLCCLIMLYGFFEQNIEHHET